MKKAIIFGAFLLSGCLQPRGITEQYIKTEIESHQSNQYSSIKIYTIYQEQMLGTGSYLELTGCKYLDKKILVIGADKYYLERQKFKTDNPVLVKVDFIKLTEEQCQSIIDNYKILQEKIMMQERLYDESIYQDFTVSPDLFISYAIMASGFEVAAFWIHGNKFVISAPQMIRQLKKFMKY